MLIFTNKINKCILSEKVSAQQLSRWLPAQSFNHKNLIKTLINRKVSAQFRNLRSKLLKLEKMKHK